MDAKERRRALRAIAYEGDISLDEARSKVAEYDSLLNEIRFNRSQLEQKGIEQRAWWLEMIDALLESA